MPGPDKGNLCVGLGPFPGFYRFATFAGLYFFIRIRFEDSLVSPTDQELPSPSLVLLLLRGEVEEP